MLEALINIKAEQSNQCLLHQILICFRDHILFLSTHKDVEYVMTCLQKSWQYFNRLHHKITTARFVNIIIWRLGRKAKEHTTWYFAKMFYCSTGKGPSAGLDVLLGSCKAVLINQSAKDTAISLLTVFTCLKIMDWISLK